MAVTGIVHVPMGLLLVLRGQAAHLGRVVPGANAVPVGAAAPAVVGLAMTEVGVPVQAVVAMPVEGGVHRKVATRVEAAVGLIVVELNAAGADMRELAEGLGTRPATASVLVPRGPMAAQVAPLADGKEIGAAGPRRLGPIGLNGPVAAVATAVLIGPNAAQLMDPGEMPLVAIGLDETVHVLRVGRRVETRDRRADSQAVAVKVARGEPEIAATVGTVGTLVRGLVVTTGPGTIVKTAVLPRVDPMRGTMCGQAKTKTGLRVNAVPVTLLRFHSIEFGRCVQTVGRSSEVPAIEEISPRHDHLVRRRSPAGCGRPISNRTCANELCCPSRSAGKRTPPIRWLPLRLRQR